MIANWQSHLVPTNLTVWNWLFDSPYSPLANNPASALRGYTNAITKERIDYAQVKEYSTYLSTALVKKYGLKENQTVALFSPNTIWYPVAMLGILRAGSSSAVTSVVRRRKGWWRYKSIGGVVSGASPAYNIEEMTYALKTGDAKFLMTLPSSMKVAAAAAKNAGIPKERVFLLEGEMEGFTTMKQLLEMGKAYGNEGQLKSFQLPKGKQNKDVCGFLSFSSGTTGLPKAVRIPRMLWCPQHVMLTVALRWWSRIKT